jgi:hypothetical protein
VQWQYYPQSDAIPTQLRDVVRVFDAVHDLIRSPELQLPSNDVLAAVRPGLEDLGFKVEAGKTHAAKIRVPVLFGMNGTLAKSFEADAHDPKTGVVVEVEAGRAYTNNQFLKDLFEACMMHDVFYAVIAVRYSYRTLPDFDRICAFFNTLYASRRLELPLKGLLLIGY